ncbi:DUF4870 domain-containing protein [Nocardia niigatensis]
MARTVSTYPMTSSQPPANQPQSAGLDKKTSAILSYALGWLTGIIFLFVGKNDPDVKFHAAQSIVFFGAVSVVNIVLSIVGSLLGVLGIIFSLAGLAVAVFAVVIWIMAMVQAKNTGGARAALPIVGKFTAPYADQLANSVK